jgi:hypothetical protein
MVSHRPAGTVSLPPPLSVIAAMADSNAAVLTARPSLTRPELPQIVDGRGGRPLPQRRHDVLRHRRTRVEPHAAHGGALPQEDEREAQQLEREQASPEWGRGPPPVVVRGASTPPRGGNDRPGGDCRGRGTGEEAAVVASSIGSGHDSPKEQRMPDDWRI